MKRSAFFSLSTALLALTLSAAELPKATLHLHAGPGGPRLTDETGAPLALGQEVRVGLLPDSFDAGRFGWDPVEIARFWQPLGSATTRALLGDAGRFATTVETTASSLSGRRVYVWILRSADGQAIRSDYANVRAHALVSGSSSAWTVPDPTALPPANSRVLGLGQADTIVYGLRTTPALGLERPGQTYPEWAAVTLAPDAAGQTAFTDLDHDGLANALEFVLGTDPKVAATFSPAFEIVTVDGKRYLQMTLRLPRGRLDIPWTVDGTSDLTTWAATPFVAVANQHDGTDLVVARDNVAIDDADGKRFLRLNARP